MKSRKSFEFLVGFFDCEIRIKCYLCGMLNGTLAAIISNALGTLKGATSAKEKGIRGKISASKNQKN